MKKPAPAPAADWEVLPTTPWNYGLRLGQARERREAGVTLRVVERPVGPVPFARDAPPVEIEVDGTSRAGMAAGGRLGRNAPAKPRRES